jgi:hypothetical protein
MSKSLTTPTAIIYSLLPPASALPWTLGDAGLLDLVVGLREGCSLDLENGLTLSIYWTGLSYFPGTTDTSMNACSSPYSSFPTVPTVPTLQQMPMTALRTLIIPSMEIYSSRMIGCSFRTAAAKVREIGFTRNFALQCI